MEHRGRALASASPVADRSGRPAARFLAAVGVSFYGDWLTTVALVVLLYRLTGSATAPALYVVARVAPRVVGPAPGGLLADRFGPAIVAASCALVQAGLAGLIVVSAYAHVIWAVYMCVAGSQFLNAVSQPSLGALLPRVANERNLGRINGIYNSLFSSSILVGPAVGALLLPRVAPEVLIVVDAFSFLFAAVLLVTLHQRGRGHKPAVTGGFSAGLPIVMRDGVLRSYAAASLGNPAVVTTLQAVLVVAASQRFGHDTDVGWLYAAVGAGALIGSLSFIRPTPTHVRRRGIVVASFIELAPLAVFVFAPTLWLAVLLLFISSLGGILYQVNGAIALQQHVPTELLGRVNAVIRSALYLGMLLGALAALALVQPLTWQGTLLVVSGAAFLFLLVAALKPPPRTVSPLDAVPD